MPSADPSTKPADPLPRRFAVADLVVDTGRVEVTRAGERVPTPGLSFDLLVQLARSAPNVVTYDELLDRVWRGVVVSPETISQRVKLLRDALGDDPRVPRYVAGVRGRGYRLVPDVIPLPDVVAVHAAASVPPEPTTRAAVLGIAPTADAETPIAPGAPAPPTSAVSPVSASAPASPAAPTSPSSGTEADRPGLQIDRAHGAPPASVASAPSGAPSELPHAASRRGMPRWRPAAIVAASGIVAVLTVAAVVALRERTPAPAASSEAESGAGTKSVDVVGVQPRAVAVLPFQNLSADPQNAFIGLGIAEMVLNRLASSDTLFVLARSSSFAFQDRNLDAREIGRQLGARYLVQGSVQRAGDRLRVTAQLVDSTTGRQLDVFQSDRDLKELFDLQDELASQMAAALDTKVEPSVRGTASLDAHLEYLQGLAALARWTPASAEAALGNFRRAQQIDPKYALAYVGEAEAVRLRVVVEDGEIETVKPRLAELVERALALDPNLGQAYVLRSLLQRDPAEAERDLRRGIALAPNYGEGYYRLATRLSAAGRRSEAIALYDRAIAIDPMRVRYRFIRALEAQADGESWEQTRARLLAILEIDPKSSATLAELARSSALQGDHANALIYAERALATDRTLNIALFGAVEVYFLVEDVDAAVDVARGTRMEPAVRVAATLARGDRVAAGALAMTEVPGPDGKPAPPQIVGSVVELAVVAAITNEALRTKDYARAIRLLTEHHCGRRLQNEEWCLRPATIMALISIGQLEILAGDRRGGDARLERAKRYMDSLPQNFGLPFAARARIAAIRGRADEALRELAAAERGGRFLGWWVTLPHDATFDELRSRAEFQAIMASARARAAKEREKIEALRTSGQLPRRPAPAR